MQHILAQAGSALITRLVCDQLRAGVQGAELCKQEVFRQVEDRPILKQRTRFMREHHIFEKTYVREVRQTSCSFGMHGSCQHCDTPWARLRLRHLQIASIAMQKAPGDRQQCLLLIFQGLSCCICHWKHCVRTVAITCCVTLELISV